MLLLITLLSGLAYGSAFVFPYLLGWLVLPSLTAVCLVLYFCICSSESLFKISLLGLAWGWAAYAVSHYWTFFVVIDNSTVTTPYAFGLTIIMAFVMSLSVVLWWFITGLLARLSSSHFFYGILILVTSYGYFLLMNQKGGIIMGQDCGYPLFSPAVPLSAYPLFLSCVRHLSSATAPGHYMSNKQHKLNIEFKHLKPVINKRTEQKLKHLQSKQGCGQGIYLVLQELTKTIDPNKKTIIVSPESSFPHCLNEAHDHHELWSNGFPSNAHLLIGSQHRSNKKGKRTQAIYHMTNGRITDFYVKKHLMPFGETPPPWFIAQFLQEKWFGQTEWMERNDCQGVHTFSVEGITIIPQVCSEFLACNSRAHFFPWRIRQSENPTFILFFVNDSWFRDSFNDILKLYAALRQAWIGIPVIYIGHDDLIQ